MFIVLFGLSGTGKNYVSRIMAKNLNFVVLNGDDLLPEDMLESIARKIAFTQAQRDRFTETLIAAARKITAPNIVLVQALYKNKNRERISEAFPHCQFIQVTTRADIIAGRLQKRDKMNALNYAQKISPNFEPPTHPFFTLTNHINNDEFGIMAQLRMMLPDLFLRQDGVSAERESIRFCP